MNLTEIKQRIFNRRVILVFVFLIIIILVIFLVSIRKGKDYTIKEVPPPAAGQPVKEGKFDKTAEPSKKSKAGVDKIKNKLPHREEFTTSTGTNVSYTIFYKPTDEYSLYIETTKINLFLPPENEAFPKEVQNFRETAGHALGWLDDQGIDINTVYLTWGSGALQKAAETLYFESAQYPKVIQNGDKWVFEKADPQSSSSASPEQ